MTDSNRKLFESRETSPSFQRESTTGALPSYFGSAVKIEESLRKGGDRVNGATYRKKHQQHRKLRGGTTKKSILRDLLTIQKV